MAWTRLIPPPARDWHPEETGAVREELAADVAGILASREKFDAEYERIAAQPLDEVNGRDVFNLDIPQHSRFEILQWELRVRKRMAEFYPREDEERNVAYTAAFEVHEKKSADIRKKLLRIGFLELVPGVLARGTFPPGLIVNHPEVRDAKDRTDALRLSNGDLAKQNDEGTAELLKEMNGLRQRALVG